MTAPTDVDRFCSRCGQSLVPLAVPHLTKACSDCGKIVHFVRAAPDGSGIQIQAGERLTIPKGFLQLSLDPSSHGKLFRSGLPFLLKMLFVGNYPKQPTDMSSFVEALRRDADATLKRSELLSGLDLEKESDGEKALERLKGDQTSRDWHAMTMGTFCQLINEAIEKKSAPDAAWAGYMLGTVRGLTIVTEPLFEQTLWRDYLANQVVYEAAAAASQTPGEAEAINKLEPLFRTLDEATLHTWVESGLPIGPRIGVKALPEAILAALAKWHLASFQREREQARLSASERRATWELRIRWLTLGIAAAGVIFTALKLFGIV